MAGRSTRAKPGCDERDHGRGGDRRADGGFPRRPAGEGGDGRRDRRAARARCASTSSRSFRAGPISSTRPAREATAGERSTSRRRRRSSRLRRAQASRSTATAPSPRRRARPTCSRRSASSWSCRPSGSRSRSTSSASASSSPRAPSGFRHAAPVRRELGARTVFNVLGPLTNPAGARAQIVGVYRRELVPVIADVLARLGASRAFVVHGERGIDELSPAGPNTRRGGGGGGVSTRVIDPLELGVPLCAPGDLRGGTPAENAAAINAVLHRRRPGAHARHPPECRRRDRRGRPRRRSRRGPATAAETVDSEQDRRV